MVDSRQSQRFSDVSGHRRRAILGVALTVTMLGIGTLIGRGVAPERQDPLPRDDAKPAGSPSSQEAAVAAATMFARIMTGPSGDEETYRTEMLEIAAPDWRDRADELAKNAIDFVNERYGPGGRVSFYPIRYRVDSYSEEEASIDIWGMVLGSGPRLAGIEESWITGTILIRWVEGDWKVAGQSSHGGPTPDLLEANGDPAVPGALDEFEEYEDAPRP